MTEKKLAILKKGFWILFISMIVLGTIETYTPYSIGIGFKLLIATVVYVVVLIIINTRFRYKK